jgi:ABC-2 type transport system permease protein
VQFPRLVIPATVVSTAFLNLLLNLVAVFVFAAIRGVQPHWQWLELPVIVLLMVVLTSGWAMLVSCLFVRYRDVKPIWEVVAQALFYATPVIWTIETIDKAAWIKHLLMCNPVAAILLQMRHAVIDPTAPSAAAAIGGAPRLLIPIGIIVGTCAIGFWKFNREAPRIAEDL